MSIVLKETEWAKNAIDDRELGKKPYETMCRVARYYIDQGYSKKDARSMLDKFLIQCDPYASLYKWEDTLDRAMNRALKYDSVNIDKIQISKNEIDIISSIKGKQIQRLAFTLLCIAKYWMIIRPYGDWWINEQDSEIMKMANINTSIKRQSMMFNSLYELGLIRFSRKIDGNSMRVCFADDTGTTAITVSDFRNLGYQYMKYTGEPFFECSNCGITVKYKDPVKGKKQKYCPQCAIQISTKQRVNAVTQHRERAKIANY